MRKLFPRVESIQRDLEDQIEEEYKGRGSLYERTEINKTSNMSVSRPIVVQDVLELLQKGCTRYRKDDRGHGSIQDHYSLTGVEVKDLFNHPKLKQRKTIFPKAPLNIVDRESAEIPQIDRITDEQIPQEINDNINRIIEEAKQDVEVKQVPLNKEELFS